MDPTKLYLTPVQLDLPGLEVVRVRLTISSEGDYVTEFQQEKDVAREEWQQWNPNKRFRI